MPVPSRKDPACFRDVLLKGRHVIHILTLNFPEGKKKESFILNEVNDTLINQNTRQVWQSIELFGPGD